MGHASFYLNHFRFVVDDSYLLDNCQDEAQGVNSRHEAQTKRDEDYWDEVQTLDGEERRYFLPIHLHEARQTMFPFPRNWGSAWKYLMGDLPEIDSTLAPRALRGMMQL